MIYLQNFITTTIQLNIYLILVIGLLYVIIHYYRNKGVNAFLDIYLNYIPVLHTNLATSYLTNCWWKGQRSCHCDKP